MNKNKTHCNGGPFTVTLSTLKKKATSMEAAVEFKHLSTLQKMATSIEAVRVF